MSTDLKKLKVYICVSVSEVLELQECVTNLQTLNNELQNRLSLAENSDDVAQNDGAKSISSSPWKQVRVQK